MIEARLNARTRDAYRQAHIERGAVVAGFFRKVLNRK